MYGYGAPAHNNGTDLQAVAYSYKPPTSGALMAGIGVSQCAWPPPAGTYGLVLCNIQFAFARQGGVNFLRFMYLSRTLTSPYHDPDSDSQLNSAQIMD